jgi:flavin-dependent dehydrogenase
MRKNIAIIGGSTAGFFTAYRLAQQGFQVRVFEAAEHIDPSPRTLIVTRYMQSLLGDIGESAVVHKIRRFELFADGRVASISLQSPDMVIDRSKLIQNLAEEAKANGAQVLTNRRFLSLKPNGRNLTFTVSCNGDRAVLKESTDIIVGADGVFSKVARSAGWPQQATVHLMQAIVDLPKDQASDTTRVWFIPEETPYFFWLIPHSATQGVLGLIGEELEPSKRSLECFMERKNLVPTEFQSAMVPRYERWIPNKREFGKGQIYLVGDAAGHVKVSTVGGIVTGFRGALGTVEAILNGGFSRQLQALRRELDLHKLTRSVIHGFTQKDYVRLLGLLTPSTRRSLSCLTRDESWKLVCSLIFKQPRLLILGLRSLLINRFFSRGREL